MNNLSKNGNKVVPFWQYVANKKLNEASTPNIKVEVEWWDDAISAALNQVHNLAGNPVNWEALLNYCRAKCQVLNREVPMMVDDIILTHIKDLIFQYFGDSMFSGTNTSSSSYQSAELATKTLAVTQVSEEILRRIKVESGIITEPEESTESENTVASVSLDNNTCDDGGMYENVCSYETFSKMLNEAYIHLQFDHYNSVLDKCLKALDDLYEGGGIALDKILKRAKKEVNGKDGMDCIDKYLVKLVRKQMDGETITVQDTNLNDQNISSIDVLKSAKNLFVQRMVEDLKSRIVKNEKVK